MMLDLGYLWDVARLEESLDRQRMAGEGISMSTPEQQRQKLNMMVRIRIRRTLETP